MAAGESKIEEYFIRRVKESGGKQRKVRWLSGNGAADRLAWWKFPRAAMVELKAPLKKVDSRSLQAREMRRMREDGWLVYEINSFEGVDRFIFEMTGQGVDGLK